MEKRSWHALTPEDVVENWLTDPETGLSTAEAGRRLTLHGYNELTERQAVPWWQLFIAQFRDFMVLVLLCATLISAFLGEYVDAITILAIVLINAVLGFIQENRAERSIKALKKLSAPNAAVIRDGCLQHVPARELVPGDILVHEAGDKIAADARLIASSNLEIEEAALTGESLPVRKASDRAFDEATSLGDRKNMVYAGTCVTRGRGRSVVCDTGPRSEVGRIADMIQDVDDGETPLQRRLEHLGKLLVWGCLAICAVVVALGIFKGEPVFLMCMAGISLAVAAIPEGLPAIVTVCLTLGVQRMIKENAIIRRLPAVETLGCVTVICSDKTGTLTQNAMTVRKVYSAGSVYDVTGSGYEISGSFLRNKQEFDPQKDKNLELCLITAALCNNSVIKQNNVAITGLWRKREKTGWSVEGDPTEGALAVAAAKAGIWRESLEKAMQRVEELPFESERRLMSVVYRDANAACVYSKGAPDTVLKLCKTYCVNGKEMPLDADVLAGIYKIHNEMTSEALRVLALAYRRLDAAADGELEQELVFAGLIGMIDPPREEAKQAISLCREAGIKAVMITGDHPNTAIAIANELRLSDQGGGRAMTGSDLDAMSDQEFSRIAGKVAVYARVSPAHKLRIVKALKQNGHIVAMTGDGVNDAPAVKEADIGISMGMTGTDVTKEASAMILADDNFATIVAAVEEGRGIYDNIRKFIRYLLSCNIGEVLTMFVASLAGLPLPLLPVQVLWVNLVTDGLPALALGVDPTEANCMRRPPRHPKESVFSRGLSRKIIGRGLQIGISTVLVFTAVYLLREDLALARTMAFSTLVLCQLFHVFDCRSETYSIFEVGLFTNPYLLLAVAASLAMQLSVIYVPFLSNIFSTVPMTVADWLFVVTVSGWTFILSLLRYLVRVLRGSFRSVPVKIR
ncbi:MAG: calcium-transporting P-type ATPase, PMR1-type [Sporomusaceae bacterium]|nr:calcium-transporting P-type ATPase, PMR1-type [Sporomusaceae bacterium]